MTRKNHDNHITHYLVLFVGLFFFVSLFILFRHNSVLQMVMGISGSLFYMLWGVIHHALEGRLTKPVIAEYILFGLLVIILLLTAIL